MYWERMDETKLQNRKFEMNKRNYEKRNICKVKKICRVLENALTKFWIYLNENKTNASSVIIASHCFLKNIYIFLLINNSKH